MYLEHSKPLLSSVNTWGHWQVEREKPQESELFLCSQFFLLVLAEITASHTEVTPPHTLHQGWQLKHPQELLIIAKSIVVIFYRSLLWDFFFVSFFFLTISWSVQLRELPRAPRAVFVPLKPRHRNLCSVTGAARPPWDWKEANCSSKWERKPTQRPFVCYRRPFQIYKMS